MAQFEITDFPEIATLTDEENFVFYVKRVTDGQDYKIKLGNFQGLIVDTVSSQGEDFIQQIVDQLLPDIESSFEQDLEQQVAEAIASESVQAEIEIKINEVLGENYENPYTTIVAEVNSIIDNAKTNKKFSKEINLVNTTLDEVNNEKLPALQEELDNLNNVVLPEVNETIEQVIEELAELENLDLSSLEESLSELEENLEQSQSDLATLQDTTIPAINEQLTQVNDDIDTLNNITLPSVDEDIQQVQDAVDNLNDVTIPAINSDLSTLNGLFPIETTSISDDAITTDKIAANTIIGSKIVGETITGDKIAANTISAGNLVAGTITANEIASLTITGDQIQGNTISGDKIIANTITSDNILAGTITADELASNSVTTDKILAGSVTTDKMVANSINGDRITTNTLNASKIIAGTISADKLVSNTITSGQIAALTITGDEIAANTISGDKIIANSIGAGEITAGSITSDEIAANTILGDNIAGNTITGDLIQANAIDASHIQAAAVEADAIKAGVITGDKIASETITGDLIAASTIQTTNLVVADLDNLVGNPKFEDVDGNASTEGWVNVSETLAVTNPQDYSGAEYVGVNAARSAFYDKYTNVTEDTEFYVSGYLYNNDCNYSTRLGVHVVYSDGSSRWIGGSSLSSTGLSFYEATIKDISHATDPTNIKPVKARFLWFINNGGATITGSWYGSNFAMRLRKNGQLIVDGSITATQIAAEAIDATKLTADAIDGKIITGAFIRTSDSTSVPRVAVGDSSFPLWYGTGNITTSNMVFGLLSDGTVYAQNMVIEGNSVFKGELDGVDGVFVGTVSVGATIGSETVSSLTSRLDTASSNASTALTNVDTLEGSLGDVAYIDEVGISSLSPDLTYGFSNIIPNATLYSGDLSTFVNWSTNVAVQQKNASSTAVVYNSAPSKYFLSFPNDGSYAVARPVAALPAEGGQTYYVSCYTASQSSTTQNFQIRMDFNNIDGETTSKFALHTSTSNVWTKHTAVITAPDDAVAIASVYLVRGVSDAASGYMALPVISVAVTGDQILDGAIEAAKLGSTVIDGGYIKTDLLDVDTLLGNNAVFTGSVTGGTITGGTITGATLQTASSGARAVIEDDGTYMLWLGSGTKNDTNAYMYVKKPVNGIVEGFIQGSWLEGEIMEEHSASGSTSASVTHSSRGNTVTITYSGKERGWYDGDYREEISDGNGLEIEVRLQKTVGGTTTTLETSYFNGQVLAWEPELGSNGRTLISTSGSTFYADTSTSEEDVTYKVQMTAYNGLVIVNTRSVSISTSENLIG